MLFKNLKACGLLAFGLALLAPPAFATSVTVASYRAIQAIETGAPSAGSSSYTLSAVLTPLYFPAGSGNQQASQLYVAHSTITSSSSSTLTLTSGLTDPLGNSVTFTGLKGAYICADSTNASTITIGNAASHAVVAWFGGTTPTESIPAGGCLLHDNPGTAWTVGSGSTDQLKINNDSGAASAGFTIVLWN